MLVDLQIKQGATLAHSRHGALNITAVAADIDVVQVREVQITVIRNHGTFVLFNQVRPVVACPIVVNV